MKFETKYFITENRRFSICFYLIIVDFIISNLLCLELHADFKKIIIIIYLAIILLSIFEARFS